MDRSRLRELLRTAFNEAELQDICFEISIDYEELSGQNKLEKIRELIGYCQRVGRLPDLITVCQKMRPRLAWQDTGTTSASATELEKLERAIAALEAQRAILGDAVVAAALPSLQQQLEALKSPKLPPQQKQVTVLYARQSGFTMMYQGADLETLRDLVEQAWQRLDTAVTQHGGLVNGRSGEQLTALFGADTAHPDDPARAVKAALEMQASLAEMKKEQEIPLSIRIGLSTGSVLLEQVEAGGKFAIIGDTVKIANLLEDSALPDSILIADSTYDQVRGVFAVARADPVAWRGRAEPLPCYLVQGVKEVAFTVERHGIAGVTTRMIGREFELRQLTEAFLTAAEDGERQMVTITGESGLGKTRLLDEFFDWLELRPDRIKFFKAEAQAETQDRPYGLLRSLLAQRIAGLEKSEAERLGPTLAGFLADTFLNDGHAEMKAHFIGHLLGFDFADSPHLQPVDEDPKQLQDRATLYLTEYFELLSRRSPVVIFLENLHWADDSSLDFLNRLALGLIGNKVLIAAAARPSFSERRPHWGEGYEWHIRLTLRPLSRRESSQLLGQILQKMDDPPDFLRQQILDKAAGNPLYMVEITKMLLRDGTIVEEGEAWKVQAALLSRLNVPSTLVGILQANLDALPLPERGAVRQAAVVGTTFWNRTVAYLAGDASGEQIETTDRILAQLHYHEIISRRETSRFVTADEYAFRNVMLRQVAQESIPGRARQVYHGLAAKWLLEQSGGQPDENAGEIADHLERSGQKEKAAAWLQRAGDWAAARSAHAEAIAYFSRALALIPNEDSQTRLDLLLKREEGCHLRGERALQADDLAALESLATRLNEAGLQAQVALRRARYAEAISDYPTAVVAAQSSLMLAQKAGDDYLAGRAYLDWGTVLWRQGNYEQAKHCLEQALTQSRIAAQPKLEMEALRRLGIIVDETEGKVAAARAYVEQSLAIARQIRNRQGEAWSLNSLGALAGREGDYDKACAYYEQSLAIAQQIGNLRGESIAFNNLGVVAKNKRDYVRARAYYDQSLAIVRQISDRLVEGNVVHNLGNVYSREGNYADARVHNEQALAIARQVGVRSIEGHLLAELGEIARHEGDYAVALDYYQQALVIQRELGNKVGQGYGLTYLGHALTDLGELEAADTAFEAAMTLRSEMGQPGLRMDTLAGLARVALAHGDLKKAFERVNEIVAWLEKYGTDGMEYPLQVQLTCYRVLNASAATDSTQEIRAIEILSQGYTELMAQADRFSDPSQRQMFLENIPYNREIMAAWEARHDQADG
ncbi:MAG: tetratricopeptide repeat protein [Anaerolineaceae bacterium]|nr:tetratricopeptide repeat protein [Anaerolineaceae bacterium]